jgi:hypothetical protein
VAEEDFHVTSASRTRLGTSASFQPKPPTNSWGKLTDLLRLDRLSEAQAAAILGVARWELLELMGRYDVPVVRMSAEELDRELATEVKRNGAK